MGKIVPVMVFALCLQGCITSVVTAPVKVTYKTTKGVVKGTTKVVRAVTPDGHHKDSEKK